MSLVNNDITPSKNSMRAAADSKSHLNPVHLQINASGMSKTQQLKKKKPSKMHIPHVLSL